MMCERENLAADRRRASKLIDIADEILAAAALVRAGQMASAALPPEDRRAIAELLGIVGDRLTDVGTVVAELIEKGDTTDAA